MKAQLHATTRYPYGSSGLKASAIISAPTDRRRADAQQANDEQHTVDGTKQLGSIAQTKHNKTRTMHQRQV